MDNYQPVYDQDQETQNTEARTNPYAIPAAIIIAGFLVAGAIFYSDSQGSERAPNSNDNLPTSTDIENIRPVSEEDHLLGDPEAAIVLVEFSDLECPYCKQFHETLQQVMQEYGPSGKVAWVYRHFPLTQIHPKAVDVAEASECAAKIGGNDGFWKYITRYFVVTPSNNNIDLAMLPIIAGDVGLDTGAFRECLEDNSYQEKIEAHYRDALSSGGQGTPYTVGIVQRSGEKFVISGAQPYAQIKQIIDQALEN